MLLGLRTSFFHVSVAFMDFYFITSVFLSLALNTAMVTQCFYLLYHTVKRVKIKLNSIIPWSNANFPLQEDHVWKKS